MNITGLKQHLELARSERQAQLFLKAYESIMAALVNVLRHKDS